MVKAKGVPGSLSNPCQNNVQTPCGDSGSGNENPCRIIPKRVCVELALDEYDNTFGCEDYECKCEKAKQYARWDCEKEHYAGTITCEDISFDYKLTFEFDDGGYCVMCLESECINIRFTEKICETDFGSCKDPLAEFDIDIENCGDSDCTTATLTVTKADDFCPPGTGGCLGCQGCGCICRCLCISYQDGKCADSKFQCWDESSEHWQVTIPCGTSSPPACGSLDLEYAEDVTLTITLIEGYEGQCALLLEASNGEVYEDEKTPACPSVSVTWEYTTDDGDTAQVKVECGTCRTGCGGGCKCQGHELPPVLTWTITEATGECSGNALGDCLQGHTSALACKLQPFFADCGCQWRNTNFDADACPTKEIPCPDDGSEFCSQEQEEALAVQEPEFDVNLLCPPVGTISSPDWSGTCQAEDPDFTCDPFFLEFNFDCTTVGCDCDGFNSGGISTVEVTP